MTHIRAERLKIYTSGILGSIVKIFIILNIDTTTSAKITIDSPSEIEKVTSVNMTKDADRVYSYVYQSDADDEYGDYVLTATFVDGTSTLVVQDKFQLLEQE